MKPIIVLMAGAIGSGKDTAADYLVEHYGFTKLNFAGALKAIVAQLFQFPPQWCHTREGKERKPPLGNGLTVGQILQQFGTQGVRSINPDLWVQLVIRDIEALHLDRVVITDCRFGNEATLMFESYQHVGLFSLTRKAPHLQGSRDAAHESERLDWVGDIATQYPVFEIDNADATLEETQEGLCKLMGDILTVYRLDLRARLENAWQVLKEIKPASGCVTRQQIAPYWDHMRAAVDGMGGGK